MRHIAQLLGYPMKFSSYSFTPEILRALDACNYDQMTPVQQQAIPAAGRGKDILANAQTGTGKTAAFALPILQQIADTPKDIHSGSVRALILVPTRELAQQVEQSIAKYGKGLKLRTITLFGGVRIEAQTNRFKRGADIIVATPKRLIDLLKLNVFSFKDIEHFLMDEADRLVSMGIHQELRTILSSLPKKKQIILFSATDSKALAKFSEANQVNANVVKTNDKQPAFSKIVHTMYRCFREDKTKHLFSLIKLLDCDKALIFTRTKQDVNRLTEFLTNEGHSCQGIHNEVSQRNR